MTEQDLPSSWARVELQDIATLNPRILKPDCDAKSLVHFVPMSAVCAEFGGVDVSMLRPLHEVQKGYTSFTAGDVLFAKITPCMENGKGALVPPLPNAIAFGSTEFHVLRSEPGIDPRWLAHFLSQAEFRRFARQHMTGSAGQMRVSTTWLAGVAIPSAPAAEQIRIIEKLEELLSDLDAGLGELFAAQKKLARYRQSLLKAAMDGSLTATWRQGQKALPEHSRPSETGAELVQRILIERRARWETKQLARLQQQGKAPPKDWKNKYREPVSPAVDNLSPLPAGWEWASLDQLAEFITSGSRGWAEYYASTGAIFIRSQNINTDTLDLNDIAFVNPPPSSEGARTLVRSDDLLLTITGANVGKIALVEMELSEAYVSQHVALIRPLEPALSQYLHLFLTSGVGGRKQLNEEAYGAGKPGLNLQQVAAVVIPVPGHSELVAMLESLTAQLEAHNDQSSAIENAIKQLAAQRKNLLKAAFSGQLVPQDPNDEPASMLLERIRAERAARASQPRERRTRDRKIAA